MARVRVPLVYRDGAWQVFAPSYNLVPGSVLPVVAGKTTPDGVLSGVAPTDPALAALTVQVDVPDEDATAALTGLNAGAIRRRYPSHWLVTQNLV